MMFGMGHEGTTNLITKALQAVGKELETLPDPTQIHYHLPKSDAHPQVSVKSIVAVFETTGNSCSCPSCYFHNWNSWFCFSCGFG